MKKLIFIFCILFSTNALAADKYVIDPKHTNITWIINHFGYSNTIGQFANNTGTFVLDQQNPENSKVDVTIDINGLQTIVPKLTEHLKGPDFFNAAMFPKATFVSTGFKKIVKKDAIMTGDLTMLGITKPVTLIVKFNKAEPNPMTHKRVAGFSATATIKRSDWGMKFGAPGIGDEVKLLIEVEGINEQDAMLEMN